MGGDKDRGGYEGMRNQARGERNEELEREGRSCHRPPFMLLHLLLFPLIILLSAYMVWWAHMFCQFRNEKWKQKPNVNFWNLCPTFPQITYPLRNNLIYLFHFQLCLQPPPYHLIHPFVPQLSLSHPFWNLSCCNALLQSLQLLWSQPPYDIVLIHEDSVHLKAIFVEYIKLQIGILTSTRHRLDIEVNPNKLQDDVERGSRRREAVKR